MNPTVDLASIQKAAETLRGTIRKTPIVDCPLLSEALGAEIYLKLENLQKTGSFKIRGAVNKIAHLSAEERQRGVIAASAGNHAQGVALGAKSHGIKATIVMPATAPLAKVSATRAFGAEVVLHGNMYDDAYAKALELQRETGAVFLHPFNDAEVMCGQGTISLEILEELPDLDVLLVPIGGGGIVAGMAVAAKALKPEIKIIGVQTANVPSAQTALQVGHVVEVAAKPTIADGIAVKTTGTLTFDLIQQYVDEVITVTEDEIANAILYLMERNKVMAEGAGATAFAAILAGKVELKGKQACAVISGGNVDINLVDRIISKALFNCGRRFEFRTVIMDRAGELQKLLDIVKSAQANILFVSQSMYEPHLMINTQEVTLVVECIDMMHCAKLGQMLTAAGYQIHQ